MSAASSSHHHDEHRMDPRNVHGHDDHHGEGESHGSFKSYMIGFVLSVVLTAIPFWLVMGNVLPSKLTTTAIILTFAVVQMLVHIVYFLHLNTSSEGGWNMLAAIFTIVLVVITISGSIWVMYHMTVNMMPVSEHDMRTMP